jgi:hypothetical protein
MALTLGDKIALKLCEIKVNQLLEDWNDCHDEKGMFCEGGGSGSGAGGSYTPMRVPKGFVGAGTFPMHKIGKSKEPKSGTKNGDPMPTRKELEKTFPGTYDQVVIVPEFLSKIEHGLVTERESLASLQKDLKAVEKKRSEVAKYPENDLTRYDKLISGIKWTQDYVKGHDWSQDARIKRTSPSGVHD